MFCFDGKVTKKFYVFCYGFIKFEFAEVSFCSMRIWITVHPFNIKFDLHQHRDAFSHAELLLTINHNAAAAVAASSSLSLTYVSLLFLPPAMPHAMTLLQSSRYDAKPGLRTSTVVGLASPTTRFIIIHILPLSPSFIDNIIFFLCPHQPTDQPVLDRPSRWSERERDPCRGRHKSLWWCALLTHFFGEDWFRFENSHFHASLTREYSRMNNSLMILVLLRIKI